MLEDHPGREDLPPPAEGCRPAHSLRLRLGSDRLELWVDGQPIAPAPARSDTHPELPPDTVPTTDSDTCRALHAQWQALQQHLASMTRTRLRPYQRGPARDTLEALHQALAEALGACLEAWHPGLSLILKTLLDAGSEQEWIRLVFVLEPGPWAELPWELTALPLAELDGLGWSNRLSLVRMCAVQTHPPDWIGLNGALRWVHEADTTRPLQPERWTLLGGETTVLLETSSCADGLPSPSEGLERLAAGVRAHVSHAQALTPHALRLEGPDALPLDRGLQRLRRAHRQAERLSCTGPAPLLSRSGTLWVRSLTELNVVNARPCSLTFSGPPEAPTVTLSLEDEHCEAPLARGKLSSYVALHGAHVALLRPDDGRSWRQQLGQTLLELLPTPIQEALRKQVSRAQAGGARLTLEIHWPAEAPSDPPPPAAEIPASVPGAAGQGHPQDWTSTHPSLKALLSGVWWESLAAALSPSGTPQLLVQRGRSRLQPTPSTLLPLRALIIPLDSAPVGPGAMTLPEGLLASAQALEALTRGLRQASPSPEVVLEHLVEATPRAYRNALAHQSCQCVVLLFPEPRAPAAEARGDDPPLRAAIRRLEALAPLLTSCPLVLIEGGARGLHAQGEGLARVAEACGLRLISSRQAGTEWMGLLLGHLATGLPLAEALLRLHDPGGSVQPRDLVLHGGPWEDPLIQHTPRLRTPAPNQRSVLDVPWRTFLYCRWVLERQEQHLFLQARADRARDALQSGLARALRLRGRRLVRGLRKERPPEAPESPHVEGVTQLEAIRQCLRHGRNVLWLDLDTLSAEARCGLLEWLTQPVKGTLILVSQGSLPRTLQGAMLVQAVLVPTVLVPTLLGSSSTRSVAEAAWAVRPGPLRSTPPALLLSDEGRQRLGISPRNAQRLVEAGLLVRDPLQLEWGCLLEAAHNSPGLLPEGASTRPRTSRPPLRRLAKALFWMAQQRDQASPRSSWSLLELSTPRALWGNACAHALAAGMPDLAWQAWQALDPLLLSSERSAWVETLAGHSSVVRHHPEVWLLVAEEARAGHAFAHALAAFFRRVSPEGAHRRLWLQGMNVLLDVGLPRFGLEAIPELPTQRHRRMPTGRIASSRQTPQEVRQRLEQEAWREEWLFWLVQVLTQTPWTEAPALLASTWRAWVQTQLDQGALSPAESLDCLALCTPAHASRMSPLERLRLIFARFSCCMALERLDDARVLVSETGDAEAEAPESSRWASLYAGYMRACLLLFQDPFSEALPWLLERTRQHAQMLSHRPLELRCYHALLCAAWIHRDRGRFDALLPLQRRCAEAMGQSGLSTQQQEQRFPWPPEGAEADPVLSAASSAGKELLLNFWDFSAVERAGGVLLRSG